MTGSPKTYSRRCCDHGVTTSEALDKLVEEAREKAIRAVFEPNKNSNVSINVKEISKELDKLCNKCLSVSLGIKYI